MQRTTCCRIFTPALPEYPAASVRDYCSGAYNGVIDNEDHYVVQHLRHGAALEDLSQRETTEPDEKPRHKTKGNGAGE